MSEDIETQLAFEDMIDTITHLSRKHGYLTAKIELGAGAADSPQKRADVEREARATRVTLRTKIRALIPPLP